MAERNFAEWIRIVLAIPLPVAGWILWTSNPKTKAQWFRVAVAWGYLAFYLYFFAYS